MSMEKTTAPHSNSSSNSKYYRVRLMNVPEIEEDVLSTLVFEYGASGLSEALSFAQPDLTYEAKVMKYKHHELDVFFPEKPTEDFFAALGQLNQQILWKIYEEENKDWLEEWKKGFKPFQLVGPYWIIPSWEAIPESATKPIFIDPGMAFGTGTHATTQMAAYFVHKLAEQNPTSISQQTVLDVGTGTAILAILAQLAGYGSIHGIEIDPEARRVAQENIERNKAHNVRITDELLEDIHTEYDVVVANIIDGVLIKIKQELIRAVKPGGTLFLTGILTERDNHFFEKFVEGSDLKVIRRLEKDEWVGYWLKKPTL